MTTPELFESSSGMTLRPYQGEAIDALFSWWRERGVEAKPLVHLPTGAGKTIVFSAMTKRIIDARPNYRGLILAHRQELLTQAEAKLHSYWSGAPTGIYCAGLNRREGHAQIVIASRDSIASRLVEVQAAHGNFDFVIIDECHNVPAKAGTRYQKIFDSLDPGAAVAGFTATPYRMDSGFCYGDGQPWQGKAYEKPITEMIEEGYLSPIRSKSVPVQAVVNTQGVSTSAGDFKNDELAERAMKEDLIERQLDAWQAIATDRRASCFFCVNVAHAEMVLERLRKRLVKARMVHGETPPKERRETLRMFERGDLPALVNVGVLTEGWDAPLLDCIVLLRPTKSLGLFVQIVGRGLRLAPGKEDCLLLDYGQCLERFGPIDRARPPAKRGEPKDDRVKTCPQCFEQVATEEKICPACEYDFRPALDQEGRTCPSCGTENPPRAIFCVVCNEQLWTPVEQDEKPSELAVFSTDRDESKIREVEICDVYVEVAISKSTSRPYVRVVYVAKSGIYRRFSEAWCLGYPGRGGKFGARRANVAVKPEFRREVGEMLSYNPSAFVAYHNGQPGGILRKPTKILVDFSSKYQDVKRVFYAED